MYLQVAWNLEDGTNTREGGVTSGLSGAAPPWHRSLVTSYTHGVP